MNLKLSTTTMFSIFLVLLAQFSTASAACGSCLLSAGTTAVAGGGAYGGAQKHSHHGHMFHVSSSGSAIKYGQGQGNPILSAFGFLLTRHFLVSNIRAVLQAQEGQINESTNARDEGSIEAKDDDEAKTTKTNKKEEENPMSSSMVFAIGLYKNYISPLLPPACRFVPTCSQYGVQAIQEFGPSKGAILTAWRLLRCSPFGGRGYDPPKWPPVAYNYGSY